jgi:hypothetical protein
MRRPIFERIVHALGEWSPEFTQRRDTLDRDGLSPLQKCTKAIGQLAYGTPADALDEYLKIAESTSIKCLKLFVEGMIHIFGDEYCEDPTSMMFNAYLILERVVGFPVCQEVFIVCTGGGRNVPCHGRDNSATGIKVLLLLFYRSLLLKIYGYGMLFLVMLDPTTTSMCLINRPCSLSN